MMIKPSKRRATAIVDLDARAAIGARTAVPYSGQMSRSPLTQPAPRGVKALSIGGNMVAAANVHADLVLRVAGQQPAPLPVPAQPAPQAGVFTPEVSVSWRRCLHEFKLDPARDYQPTILDSTR